MATSYDYVIVGGGTAGSVLAARLSEDPSTRVLVLDFGGQTAQLMANVSGADGSYRIANVPSGAYRVIASRSGAATDSHGIADGFYYALLRKESAAGGN